MEKIPKERKNYMNEFVVYHCFVLFSQQVWCPLRELQFRRICENQVRWEVKTYIKMKRHGKKTHKIANRKIKMKTKQRYTNYLDKFVRRTCPITMSGAWKASSGTDKYEFSKLIHIIQLKIQMLQRHWIYTKCGYTLHQLVI